MKNEFEAAFNEITELRALPQETVYEALKTALVSAYRRDSNASAAQRVEAHFDSATGRPRLFVEKEVVDSVENPNTEVDLEKARYYEPECDLGDTIMVQVEGSMKKFGRIAAQTAKQVILQKIREAERNALYDEFVEKEGDILNGMVQSVNNSLVTVSLGRAEAIMPRSHQIPRERYRPHDKIRVYLLEVKKANRGPQIIVSRSHRNMLRRLLEFEVPEIYNGQIEIKNIAREAGQRSKVAVTALQDGIDPVGACVGMRGIRIQNIVKELHDEKIDVIEWNPNQEQFIEKALSPARVTGVYLDDDPDAGRTAVVIVPDEQLSLAIGREGQNARLAAKLTGWRIDIKSVTEAVTYAMEHIDQSPIMELTMEIPEMMQEVGTIIEKREFGRAIMPEEYRILGTFADKVERSLQKVREEARQARMEEINAVKSTLPAQAFEIDVRELELPDHIIESLQPLENVGEIMLRFLIDESRLRRLLGREAEVELVKVQEALDKLVFDDITSVVENAENVVESDDVDAEQVTEDEAYDEDDYSDEVERFDEQMVDEQKSSRNRQAKSKTDTSMDDFEDLQPEYYEDDVDNRDPKQSQKQKRKKRQLVFDEETGEVYAKRRRKGNRKRDSWDDF
jgi:transcription termination/antitermination protein NusA